MTQFRLIVIALPAVFGWLLLARPYEGLRHDGVLYFGQTLLHSSAPVLSHDVFFAGGSQDKYSIYAHVMAPLYSAFGYTAVHIALLFAGWLAMTGALAALLKRFQPEGTSWLWGLASFAVLSTTYGGGWIFSYSEPFVTARSFAEPLLLWSLVALVAGRHLTALALLALAALFHPLMTLPIAVLGWGLLSYVDRRWLWCLVSIPIALAAATLGLPPFDNLTRTYDPYWWALVDTSNGQVLLRNWKLADVLTVVLDLGVLLAVRRLSPTGKWRTLLDATVITTVGLISLSALASDVCHLVLPTQLQLWRVHWIAHLLATVLAPWLVARLWQAGALWRVSSCALLLALLNSHLGAQHGVAALGLWAVTSMAAWHVRAVSGAVIGVGCISIVLCVVALSAAHLLSRLELQAWQQPLADWRNSWATLGAFPTFALPCFALLLMIARQRGAGLALAALMGGAIFVASVASWDRRSDLLRAVDSPGADPHPFQAHLPEQASVFWPGHLAPVWALLARTSHYAKQQGAGLLFNHTTALIFGPRRELYRRINEDLEGCIVGATMARDLEALTRCGLPAQARLEALCRDRDAPDFLVLPGWLSLPPLAVWQPPAKRERPQSFALYSCSQFSSGTN